MTGKLEGQDPVPVTVVPDQPVPVKAVSVTPNWDAAVKVITALTPIFLALITYFTIINGNKASKAAAVADETRSILVSSVDSMLEVQDTIHSIVNSQRAAMELWNEQMRTALQKAGIKVPEEPIVPPPVPRQPTRPSSMLWRPALE